MLSFFKKKAKSKKEPVQEHKKTEVRGITTYEAMTERQKMFSIQVDRNLKGEELEQQGKIDEATVLYEQNIQERFGGNHPYDRLVFIYQRQDRQDDVIRVLRQAVDVFTELSKTSPRADVPPKLAKFKKWLAEAEEKNKTEQ